MTRSSASVSIVVLIVAGCIALLSAQGALGQTPEKWVFSGAAPEDYQMGGNPTVAHGSEGGGYIRSKVAAPKDFATLMTSMAAGSYVAKRVRMSGFVRTEGVTGQVLLWLRVDGPNDQILAFDNMGKRPITGTTEWKRHDIVLDVPAEGTRLAYGIVLAGAGQAWVDGLTLEVAGPDVPVTDSTAGWFPAGRYPEDYEFGGNPRVAHGSPGGGYLRSKGGLEPRAAGLLASMSEPRAFLGKRVRLSAYVRAESAAWAGLMMSVQGPNGSLGHDDMHDRPIIGTTDWKRYDLVLDVPAEAQALMYGMTLAGKGQVWFDGVKVEVVGADVPVTGAPEAMTSYYAGAFAEAAKAFPATIRLDPTNYSVNLLYFLSLHRSGQVKEAQAVIGRLADGAKADSWAGPIMLFLAGRLSEEELLKASAHANPTTDKQQKCEAYYYLGIAYLLNLGKVSGGGASGEAKARAYFEKSVATDVKDYIEHAAAKAELERMKR